MKKHTFTKLITSFMVFFLAFAFLIPSMITTTASAAGSNIMGSYERDDLEETDYDYLKTQLLIDQELTRWAEEERKKADEEKQNEEIAQKGKKRIEKTVETMQLLNKKVPEIVSFIKDIENRGDFDTAALITNICSSASGVANFFPPVGTIVGSAIDLISSVFTAIMGGEEAPSATALLEDNINQRFDEISQQIAGLENQIGDLSDQVNENTEKIIQEMEHAFDIAEAKTAVNEFYLSTDKDDFGYNKYKNYIYGTTEDNSNATTAYYNLLLHAQFSNTSNKEVKYYYDMLYASLAENRDVFKEFVIGSGTGKSIVQYFYDILVAHPEFIEEQGLSPELAAIQFAYDLYKTQVLADEIMLVCNNYQYTQMLLNCRCKEKGKDICECFYDYGVGKVWRSQIEGDETLDSIYDQVIVREEELVEQFAKDIIYILNSNRTFTMKGTDNQVYSLKTEINNGIICGKVSYGSTVYLDCVPSCVCDLFDIDVDDFAYVGDYVLNEDGIFQMKSSQSEVFLTYKGKVVSTICFIDNTSSTFSGGSGTKDDPYLISSAYQFKQINNGMDKYYRLIDDIDFINEEPFYPLGRTKLGSFIEYEPFNGIIDGNGHSISNLTIIGDDYAGVFGIIGEDGVVKNLSFDCVKIQMSGYSFAKESTYSFYAGIIVGDNQGTIRNCQVYSSDFENEKNNVDITSETSNEGAERSVYFYIGGIAGRNTKTGLIQFVTVSQAIISVDSTHNFHGASTSTNKNMVYAGGVCGYNFGNIKCAIVNESTTIIAKAKSIYAPKTTVNPYVTALAGGITGKNYSDDLNNIQNVYSSAKTNVNALLEIDDSESRWWECYGNRIQGNNAYVPNCAYDKINQICANANDIIAVFPQVGGFDVVFEDKTESYRIGDKSLNFDNITIKVNGNSIKYEVLEVYGFDTTNASENRHVSVLFIATIGESKQLLVADYFIEIVDYIVEITISGIESEYKMGDNLPDKVTIVQHFASGSSSPIYNVDFNIENKDNITEQCGIHKVLFTYEGNNCMVSFNVVCPHVNDKELFDFIQTISPTCQNIGYDEYKCLKCDDTLKTNYKRITGHKIVEEISVDATCQSEGKTGRVYCEFCNETFGESIKIPMKPHSIVKNDSVSNNMPNETAHFCKNGDHWISHNYYVIESYENDGIVYTYNCKDCGYVYKQKDSNIITNAEHKQPTVVVSDGYALNGDDLVTIYVQLINNPGVTGADFGIRYDSRLTLVDWSDGMLFEKIFNQTDGVGKFEDSAKPTSCGYNFVWGIEKARDKQGNLICPDGNLLKLVFKLPKNATSKDIFIVSVVYSQIEGQKTGFTVDTKVCNEQNISTISPQRFITKDGIIQLVNHLPGDVNDDNCVDILDVLYLANYLANKDDQNYTPLTSILTYGDVNLSGGKPDITDALILLRSLTGGYGEDGNPLYSKYQIVLNTNGYSQLVVLPQFVDISENTYSSILDSLESQMRAREGYKFLGWFTRLDCTCDKPECEEHCQYKIIDFNNLIEYNHEQKIQTLYARWEINNVVFQGYSKDYLNDNYVFLAPSESIKTTFYQPFNKQINGFGYIIHEFDYWLGDNGQKYYPGDKLNLDKEPGIGNLTLTPIWKGWRIDAPILPITGYNPNDVEWYIDEGTNQPVEEYGFVNFANKEMKELYGKWITPLSYTIYYELEGGSFGSLHPISVEYNEEFIVNNPTRLGYTFTGWTITGMDNTEHLYWDSDKETYVPSNKSTWNNMKEIQFKNLHSNSGTVIFTANWKANTYSITYALNGGNFGVSHPTIVNFDESFTVNNPTKLGYTFTGWTITGMDSTEHTIGTIITSANDLEDVFAISFKNLRSLEGTINFTANWEDSFVYKFNQESMTCSIIGIGGHLDDENIIIPNSYNGYEIIEISESAFLNCKNIKSLVVSDSVKIIQKNAFYGCTSIENLTLPFVGNNINSEENSHFGYIFGASNYIENAQFVPSAIKNISIVNSSVIAENSFYGCCSIEIINLSNSIKKIGKGAFSGCYSLKKIVLPFLGESIKNVNELGQYPFGYIFGEEKYENSLGIYQLYYGDNLNYTTGKYYYIPASLKEVVVKGGEVLPYVFSNCSSLLSVKIESNISFIGDAAFNGCRSLINIQLPDSLEVIGSSAFSQCESLESIDIPKNVTTISSHAFSHCSSLKTLKLPSSIEIIGSRGIVAGCNNLVDLSIDENSLYYSESNCIIEKSSKRLLVACSYSTIPDDILIIGKGAFEETNYTRIELSSCIVSIEDFAFYGCNSLRQVKLSDNITSIGYSAFSCCDSLESIEIPRKVKTIGEEAFYYCCSLTNIVFNEYSELEEIGNAAFIYCEKLNYISLPDSLLRINDAAFYRSGLESIEIPRNVEFIGSRVFVRCSNLSEISVSLDNAKYHSYGNCIIETASKKLIAGCSKSTIPTDGSVTIIGESAFEYCNFENIVIPNKITTISSRAFSDCANITNVTIPNSVTYIGSDAFSFCDLLKGVDLPSSVSYIGSSAFSSCDNFTQVIIRNKTCEIGEYAFDDVVSIQGVSNDDTCTAYVYAQENGNAYSTITCFTGDMKVMLADGTYARIDSLKQGDIVMSWNAFTGELEAMPISLFWNHGEATYDVIKLYFDNNTIVKIIAEHGFFDATLNKYVYINQENYEDYIGHEFAVVNDKGALENVLLINVEINNEECSSYSLRTACNDNAIVEGLLTLTFEDIKGFLTYFEFGENYMYDKEKLQADIEKYGLYTYDDWKEYVSYEEFVALNGQYLKIVIGKGYLSYEDILKLISGMRV